MKKICVLLFMIFMIPVVVKADMTPISVTGYSNSATVGSEVVFKLTGLNNFDGRIEYDSDELEYISIRSGVENDIVGPEQAVITDNKAGKLTFKYELSGDNNTNTNIWFTFKVKKVKNNSVKITYYPNNTSVLYGEKSKVLEYPIVVAKEQKETKKNDNTCLYISWGFAGVFAISTICLALKLKRK